MQMSQRTVTVASLVRPKSAAIRRSGQTEAPSPLHVAPVSPFVASKKTSSLADVSHVSSMERVIATQQAEIDLQAARSKLFADAERARLQASAQELKQSYELNLADLRAAESERLASMRAHYEELIQELRARHTRDVEWIKNNNEAEIQKYRQDIEALRKHYTNMAGDLEMQHATELDHERQKARETLRLQLERMEARHAEERRLLMESEQMQRHELETNLRDQLQQERDEQLELVIQKLSEDQHNHISKLELEQRHLLSKIETEAQRWADKHQYAQEELTKTNQERAAAARQLEAKDNEIRALKLRLESEGTKRERLAMAYEDMLSQFEADTAKKTTELVQYYDHEIDSIQQRVQRVLALKDQQIAELLQRS